MRRAFAILLVTVFSLPLIAPALASAPDDSQLPACCRRDGKHHCTMNIEVGNLPPSSLVISAKCPYSPSTHALFVQQHPLAAASHPAVFGPSAGLAATIGAAEAGHRISADRARHKRGPPSTLTL